MKNTILLAAILLAAAPLFSQNKGASPISTSRDLGTTTSTNSTKRAVVIGISDYQEKDIPDLRFADKDALAFASFLRSPAGGSLDNDHLQVLTNEKATAGLVAAALDALIEQTKEGDEVIIYFSGHGDVERKIISQPGFLLCWDAPSRVYMGGGTYSLAFLEAVVSTLSVENKAKVLVITDAGHAGKLAGSQIGGAQITGANLARQFANEVKILSCQPNEFSLEGEQWGGGRGIFSYHLVDGLFGLADRNGDGQVSVGEIDRYLEDKVTAEAAPQSQVPMLLGNKTERLAMVSAAILAELKKAKSSGMPLFTATESRGLEDEVLAKLDSGIVKKYFAFKKAVAEKRFFEPENDCAEVFYASLSTEPGLAPLHGFMKRNYAAVLQDGAQQELNAMLKTGMTLEVLTGLQAYRHYSKFPKWLGRAAELLGRDHYMYPSLMARQAYFEAKTQKKKKDARLFLHKAIAWQPDMPHAFVELIGTCEPTERDSADFFAKRAMEIVPGWVAPLTRLASFYQTWLKKPETADSLLNEAMRLDSSSLLVWYSKGHFYERQFEREKAIHWFQKCTEANMGGAVFNEAFKGLGDVYIQSGRFKEAEEVLLMAVGIDSTYGGTLNRLGKVYWLTDRLDEAEAAFKKEIRLSQNEREKSMAFNELGNVFTIQRQWAEAEKMYLKCLEADSSNLNPYANLSLVYTAWGQYDKAESIIWKGIGIDSTSVGYTLLGVLRAHNNNPVEAEFYGRKGVKLRPQIECYWDLADIFSLINKPADGFEALEEAIKLGAEFEGLQSDDNLANLRALPEWRILMKKHFPDKVKD